MLLPFSIEQRKNKTTIIDMFNLKPDLDQLEQEAQPSNNSSQKWAIIERDQIQKELKRKQESTKKRITIRNTGISN